MSIRRDTRGARSCGTSWTIADALIREKFADENELDDLIEALRKDLDDPGRLVTSHLFYEATGRKPPETGSTPSIATLGG